MSEWMENMRSLAQAARKAALTVGVVSSTQKNEALLNAAERLSAEKKVLFEANAADLAAGREKGLSAPLLERLRLDENVLRRLADGLRQVASLPDPVGTEISRSVRPNGLLVRRVRVPLGVVLIIYEARPNVTVEAASLCLKAGNACILRGGGEALHSNRALAETMQRALSAAGLPLETVQAVPTPDRAAIGELLKLDQYIDLVVPRGGEGLIRAVAEQSRIPVLKHYKGICHAYVDAEADLDMAEKIVLNAKLQRPATCNAAETLLVHRGVAPSFLPRIAEALIKQGSTLHVCEQTAKLLAVLSASLGSDKIYPAGPDAWSREYLDKQMSLKVVDSFESAVEHIERYGSRHTDCIVTKNAETGRHFQSRVDSACVLVNASTRLNDGFEFGLGAEIGISTDKLHARGPMGLEELTTYKWLGDGTGQLRT
jgi:glutamate-5-semialdehyde dehydrogenase